MGEAMFYQLTRRRMPDALSDLLLKTLDRGWRAVVRCGSPERAEDLNRALWTHPADSFLPHGGPEDGRAERQPIYLTAGAETPNAPHVLFLIDGAAADPSEIAALERSCLLFSGADAEALAAARRAWKTLTEAGVDAVYYAEKGGRGWEKKAEKRAG